MKHRSFPCPYSYITFTDLAIIHCGDIGLDFITAMVIERIMTLAGYLSTHSLTAAEFARRIGVSTQTVCRYRDGVRIPEKALMERIAAVTSYAVMPNDFYSLGRRAVSSVAAA